MIVSPTNISELYIINPSIYKDSRGYFFESFQKKRYKDLLGIEEDFIQDNLSFSKRNALRGLHFQRRKPQGKLISVLEGTVFDVAVDIREGSKTFGEWFGIELSEDNHLQLWLPPGMAHGFLVLSSTAKFLYKCTQYYDPNDEGCLLWNDPDINIDWPHTNIILSEKDSKGIAFKEL
jgi:dTDP-4-dehydrorhamnose 3,5-epimerase